MAVRTVGVATFAVSCIATTLGIIVTVVFLTFNVFYRNKRFVKMSSPKLNVLISAGGLSLNIACLMYGMDYFLANRYSEATVTCQMRLWLITLGMTMVFGPMFAKAWRVYQIFRHAGVKRVVIKDSKLFIMSTAFLLVDVLVLALWQSIDTMESKKVNYLLTVDNRVRNTSSNGKFIQIQECSSNQTSGWLTFLFLWKTLLLGFGLFLAWKTRNVTVPAMRDSPSIIVSILCALLLSAPTVMLTTLLRHSPDGIYITEISLVTVCTIIVQVSVFLPKVIFWWKSPLEQSRVSVKLENRNNYEYFGTYELTRLQAENEMLLRNMKEKTVEIERLQEKLGSLQQRTPETNFVCEDKRDSGLSTSVEMELGFSDLKEEPVNLDSVDKSTLRDDPQSRSFSDSSHLKQKKQSWKEQSMMTSTPEINKHCQNHSGDLNKFFSADLYFRNQYRNRCWTFSSIRSRQDIVGSVTKCYQLEENEDTFSYVSSYLPPPLPPSEQCELSLRNNSICISTENMALSNDMLYPISSSDILETPTVDTTEQCVIPVKQQTTPGKTCYV